MIDMSEYSELRKRVSQLEGRSFLMEVLLFFSIAQRGPEEIKIFMENLESISISDDVIGDEREQVQAAKALLDQVSKNLKENLERQSREHLIIEKSGKGSAMQNRNKITGIKIESPIDKNDGMSWETALALTISLWSVSKEQDNQLNCIVSDVDKEEIPKQLSNIVGRFISSIILKSFSIEIFLKFFSFKKTEKSLKTHDLKKLYDDLDNETKKVIVDISRQQGINSIETIIASHKNDFTKWRYAFEGGDLMMEDLTDLDIVIEILCLTEKKIYNTKFSTKYGSNNELQAPLTYPMEIR